MKERKIYEAPLLEIIEIEVEQGFAGSEKVGYTDYGSWWTEEEGSWN